MYVYKPHLTCPSKPLVSRSTALLVNKVVYRKNCMTEMCENENYVGYVSNHNVYDVIVPK